MESILPRYNIDLKNDFVFLEENDLNKFMFSDLSAHSHNYYILSFLYEGSVAHLSDFDKELVLSPAVLMLDIDHVHTHPDVSHSKIVSIAFSTNFISDQQQRFLQKISALFSRPFISISSDELDELDEIIKIIARESSNHKKDYELLKALFNVLIVKCLKLSESYPVLDQNKNGIYNNFKTLLKENYKTQHQVKFYADKLHISTRILSQYIKSSTFKTPKQLIDEHLLLEAKRLLYWSTISSKEVAWQLGFETDSYFNRFFKKHTGKTPKEFHNKDLKLK